MYATLSGGIADLTPTVFLYSIPSNNLLDWDFLGLLFQFPLDYRPDEKWSGSFGRNIECCSIFELAGCPTAIMGTEGNDTRWCIWMTGRFEIQDGKISWIYSKSGVIDWGGFYAASTSEGFSGDRRVLMGSVNYAVCSALTHESLYKGWILEDGISSEIQQQQGWAGMASLPRELFSLRLEHVCSSCSSALDKISSFNCSSDNFGTFTMSTIGIRPASETLLLRETSCHSSFRAFEFRDAYKVAKMLLHSRTWELEVVIDLTASCKVFSVSINHSFSMCADFSQGCAHKFNRRANRCFLHPQRGGTHSRPLRLYTKRRYTDRHKTRPTHFVSVQRPRYWCL